MWTNSESVLASHHLGAGLWTTAETLSQPGISSDFVERPRVAITMDGRAIAVWQQMTCRWTVRIALYTE